MLTLIIAFIVIILAIAGMAIGWLITGKSKIEAGACGRSPEQKQDESCGKNISCTLCQTEQKKSEFPKENEDLPEEEPEDNSRAI